jgi:hypothetical protein
MIEGANGAAGAQGMVEGVVAMLCWERERDGEYKIVDEFPDLGLRSHERTTGTEEGIIALFRCADSAPAALCRVTVAFCFYLVIIVQKLIN